MQRATTGMIEYHRQKMLVWGMVVSTGFHPFFRAVMTRKWYLKKHRTLLCSDQSEGRFLQFCTEISPRRRWRWIPLHCTKLDSQNFAHKSRLFKRVYRFSAHETRNQRPQSGCCSSSGQSPPISSSCTHRVFQIHSASSSINVLPKSVFSVFLSYCFMFYLV